MTLFLQSIVRGRLTLLYDLHTLSMELLLKIGLQFLELLFLSNQWVSEHINLRFHLSNLGRMKIPQFLRTFTQPLNLPIFILNNLIELPLLNFEKLSSSLLLLSLSDQALRSQLHLSPQTCYLLFELKSSCRKLHLKILNLWFLLGILNLEIFPQLIIFCQ